MSDGITVLQSSPAPRPTTNPYIVMLQEALERHPAIDLRVFSWRAALLERYDVFHLHWPEILPAGRTPIRRLVRGMLTLLLVERLRVRRTAVVRTVHNVQLPDGLSRLQLFILKRLDSLTHLRVALNEQTPLPDDVASVVIPHGHYREWFDRYPHASAISGRSAFVGMVRRYKGVEHLIAVFRDALGQRDDISLVVGGAPSTTRLAEEIRQLSQGEERISLRLHFLDDQEFVDIATSSELIVLPYRFMHNSGGAIAALSLDRPVLVPDNEVNRSLAEEVGENWVHRYTAELDSATLLKAISTVQSSSRSARPNLAARDWSTAGESHHAAYAKAIRNAGGNVRVR